MGQGAARRSNVRRDQASADGSGVSCGFRSENGELADLDRWGQRPEAWQLLSTYRKQHAGRKNAAAARLVAALVNT